MRHNKINKNNSNNNKKDKNLLTLEIQNLLEVNQLLITEI